MAIQENIFKKILIIGTNAFTAGHFINYMLENTDAEIVGISRSPEYNPVFLPFLYNKQRPSRYTFHQVDINQNMGKVYSILDSFRPHVVVNYAAQGEVRNSWKWPEQWYQTNCLSVVRLAEHLKNVDYLKKYVAISTPEVYGATGEKIKESHNYYPSTPYAASKLAGELHLFALHKHYDFPVVFTRAANLYGIHQQLYRIIPRAIIYLKMGKRIDLHGRGEALRAFIHARDVADLTYKAITHGKNGEVYHVAPDGSLLSIADLVRLICQLTGHEYESSINLIDENFGQDSCYSMDASKAKNELGWRQQVAFENGLQETIGWIEDNWDFISNQQLEYVHKK